MSYFASIDGKSIGDVATNSGWGDFTRWAAEIDGVADLRHLTEYGWYEGDLSEIVEQLQVAIEDAEPTPDQQSIAQGLIDLLANAAVDGVLVIGDGTGAGEDAEVSESVQERLSRASRILWEGYP